ncbi:MAG TPA: hypothetical protein VFD36_26695 [Kofleriaceae bacterium]|nr:hypothetical protein [Kofleriaceae bacterium]
MRASLAPVALVAALGSSPRCVRSSDAEPLWQAEVRAAYGLAVSGSGTQMSARATPLTVAGIAAFAFNEDPPLSGYGGLTVEMLDRSSVGTLFGVMLRPHGSHLRLTGGGVYVFAPYTLWGATASMGLCFHITPRTGMCADAQLTAYFAGSDLADGRTSTAGQGVLGLVFDAL